MELPDCDKCHKEFPIKELIHRYKDNMFYCRECFPDKFVHNGGPIEKPKKKKKSNKK